MADNRRGTVDSFQWRIDGEDMEQDNNVIVGDDPLTFLSKFEIKLYECINTLRTVPASFADRMMGYYYYYQIKEDNRIII